jgi:phytoene dehydrogenase-like protein
VRGITRGTFRTAEDSFYSEVCMDELMVVGAGVSGLVAAIEAAERGWSVTVCEARSAVGGRARSMRGRFLANIGPHALYSDGAFWRWLEERDLLPPVLATLRPKTLFRIHDRLGAWPGELGPPRDHVRPEAPVDESYRLWLGRHAGDEVAEAMIGLSFIGTYDHDPGRLSAAFVNERLQRLLSNGACYVVGGWSVLVDRLARHATRLGMRFRLRSRVQSLDQSPVIVATHLADARRLTGDPSLDWSSGRTALLDLGLSTDESTDWFRVIDLQDRIYMARYSVVDPTLAPRRSDLLQAAAACAPWERLDAPIWRIERLLDMSSPGWRDRISWRRAYLMDGQTGAVDLPGTSWQDRPAIRRSPTLAVATDQSAAPGLLSEVGVSAALSAVEALTCDNLAA